MIRSKNGPASRADYDADVLITGAGPVGLTLANVLGLYGVKALIVEKLDSIIDYPRAIGIDDESLRTLQSAGLADQVQAHITPDHWMKFVTGSGREFASIEPRTDEFGWSRRNAFIQPLIDNILWKGLSRFENTEVLFGHTVTGVDQRSDHVTLSVEDNKGETRQLRAPWLVAADGGNSFVRRALDIPFEGRTKPNQWIVVDIRNDPLGTPHVYMHCDPERPYVSAALPHGIRRFEFMVMPGETEEELSQPENMAALMRKVVADPDSVDYIRKRVYTHNARLAATFRKGRVLLAGDAAHIMPVWQGQGYNSGMRDANNLAWKLAHVVKNLASERLLDTYTQERRDHARMMIHLSEVAGDIFAPATARGAKIRDAVTLAMNVVPSVKRYFIEMRFKPMPRYEQGAIVAPDSVGPKRSGRLRGMLGGLIDRSGDSAVSRMVGLMAEKRESLIARIINAADAPEPSPVGTMFIQPTVLCEDGAHRKLDDVIGLNFAVIAWGTDPTYGLSAPARQVWEKLGARFLRVKPAVQMAHRDDAREGVVMIGDLGNRMKDWYTQWPQSIVILRPDRFVAAICTPQQISATTMAFAEVLGMDVREDGDFGEASALLSFTHS